MAEKEVCADVIKATEESSGRVEGESLLLPLLQGLLDAPDNEQTADSGTESGEDLRNGLLIEVQNVLAKLANSLKSNSNDMSEERRDSLLQLVTRLQTGLSHPTSNEKRSSGHERFSKKRRHNRHTVGVSSEELENARKLIEEMGLCKNKTTLDEHKSQEQIAIPVVQNIPIIKNVVAKPYHSPGSTSQSASCTSSTVNTPTEVTGVLQFSNPLASIRPKDHKLAQYEQIKPKSFTETVSSNFLPEIEKKTLTHKNLDNAQESETDEDYISIRNKPVENAKIMLQSNPIYSKPTTFPELDEQKINNRFNNKKLKLKRANTIDIPKPFNTYESEDDYDSDTSLVDKQNSRRHNYLALRGPIRVGRNSTGNSNVPVFEPKTDSDRKFMAFINKHNEKSDQSSLWAHQGQELNNRGHNWNNRFGNIRTAFENAAVSNSSTPTLPTNSARNFWKRTENAASYCEPRNIPKSKFPQRRSEYIVKEKEEVPQKMPWSVSNQNEVVTGTLKVETKGLDVHKNYKLVPQPQPVNKFSHAPTSAFAAIPKKNHETNTQKATVSENVIKSSYENSSETNAPLFLYSPKPLVNTDVSPSSTPWANDNTVQKLASTKFGHNTYNEIPEPAVIKPKKIHKPLPYSSIPETISVDKITAPYINKSVENANTVRKLSDQFNNKTPKQTDIYLTTTSVKSNYTVPKYSNNPVSDYTHYNQNYQKPQNQVQPQISYQTQYQKQPTEIYQAQYQKHPHYGNTKEPTEIYHEQYRKQQYHDDPKEATDIYQTQYQKQPYHSNTKESTEIYQDQYKKQPYHGNTKESTEIYRDQYKKQPYHGNTKESPEIYQDQYKKQSYRASTKEPTETSQGQYRKQSYHDNTNEPIEIYQAQYQRQPHQDTTRDSFIYKTPIKENRLPEEYTTQKYLQLKPPPKPESDVSSSDSSPIPYQTPQYTQQISQESVKEYEAAVTKVMKGPVSQQAVTVQQNSPRGRDQHDLEVALNLKNALQKFSDKSPERKLSVDSAVIKQQPTQALLPRKTQSFKKTPQHTNPNFMVNGKPLSMESTEINENGESVITSKFHIPVTIQSTLVKSPTQQMIKKADVWNQLMYDQLQLSQKPAPVGSPNSKPVLRSKSSHSLAVPTIQFQAGMTKDEVALKRKTVEAYFSGSISPQMLNRTPSDDSLDKSDKAEVKVNKSSINRKKTSEKVSVNKHSSGVVRSQTLPNIACPDLLDESKVEESFEDLFRSNA